MNATIIKAARAGLDWTQARLAAESSLHPKSVAYWERMSGEFPDAPNGAPRKIKDALARHGVFIDGHVVHFHMVANR